MWIDRLFANRIRQGTLTLRFDDGSVRSYGSGEPHAVWQLRSPRVLRRIAAHPEFMLGQTYMDGEWDAPEGLPPLLQVLGAHFRRPRVNRLLRVLAAPLQQWNAAAASRRHVRHHYDLDEAMFRQFLDSDMHYSCAYFADGAMTLEAAQQAKCELIRRKLHLRPGMRVLDIGCGWGGLAMYLAERGGVEVTGITLSTEQHRVAAARARERGLEGQVRFLLEDYRDHQGQYDRIVSVGMFEHVGRPFFRRYFGQVHALLVADGVALIHTIGRPTPPALTNPWIRRYIFPGGYIPAMSEVMAAVEPTGLICADVEVLRRHYAYTLEAWLQRFGQGRSRWVERRGEAFCRMWEFYLAACANAFRLGHLVVFQFQFCRSPAALPITRDYVYQEAAENQAWGAFARSMGS